MWLFCGVFRRGAAIEASAGDTLADRQTRREVEFIAEADQAAVCTARSTQSAEDGTVRILHTPTNGSQHLIIRNNNRSEHRDVGTAQPLRPLLKKTDAEGAVRTVAGTVLLHNRFGDVRLRQAQHQR